MEYTPRMMESRMAAHGAAVGSMVLLRNVNQTLPLEPAGSEPLPIAVFGMGQIDTAMHCAEFQPWRTVNILDGLSQSELVCPDGLLTHKYRSWKLHHPGEAFPWESLSMEEFAENNAAAVVVVTRTEDAYDPILHLDERELMEAVTKAFSRTVLVLNTPGYMEIAPVAGSFGAVVYMGIAGQEGGAALAELLTGRAVFAGHLNQSWPLRRADFTQANQKKDIYCGYRYFDSFGTDVLYDFGYGLTYGAAEMTAVSMAVDGKELVVEAEITNTGSRWPVSQVVQVYSSRPSCKLEQPKQVLQCFGRTAVLDPGESQRLTLRFDLTEMSTFSEDASAFVMEAGYYEIRVGFSSRSAMVVGAVRLMRDEVVQPVLPMEMPRTENRPAALAWTYPGEEEERELARKRAIRLATWNISRFSVRKPRPAMSCRPADHPVRLEDVKRGDATVYALTAALDDRQLRHLVMDFGFCPSDVEGALGASADLKEEFGIPALTVAAGADGLLLIRDRKDEEDKVVGHQYVTAFPAASLLGCSWDPELVSAVGAAVGREMKEYGVDLWLAPGTDVLRGPGQRHASRCWSEDPVVCGVLSAAVARGVAPYGAAVLRAVSMEHQTTVTQRAYHDIYSLGFAIAAPTAKALLIPAERLNGEHAGEDTAQSDALRQQWKFGGMCLADNERFAAEPDRICLEQAAIRILRFAATKA